MNDKIDKFFRILNETKEPAYDVETTGLDWKHNKCIGYSISDGRDAVYIPTAHTQGGNISNVDAFERNLNGCLNRHLGTIVGHNVKFDMHFSENQGIKFNRVADTMVREALIDENQRSYSLENVCTRRPGITPKRGKDLYHHIAQKVGCKNDRSAMGHFHLLRGDDPIAVEYAEGDTLTTKQLYDAQARDIFAQGLEVVSELESNLTIVLQEMERKGVGVDLDEVAKVKKQVAEMVEDATVSLYKQDEDGNIEPINIRSGRDLKEYFQQCEIDDWPMTAPSKRFPNGQPSFNKDFLASTEEGLRIMNARRLLHLQSSFTEPIDRFIYNARIHTTFHQTRGDMGYGTGYGRLSSTDPNVQQVPKRDAELGKIYRRVFVPKTGYVFVEFDYSQAEPRLFTHYSQEPILLKGYNASPCIDMHAIAAEYMGITRETAKSLNLGIMYTMGPKKLAIKLGITYDDAKRILNRWQETFPRVSSYNRSSPGFTQAAQHAAEQRGYVKTILGRRSRFDDAKYAYRAANRIVQGGSADILKWKLVQLHRHIKANNLQELVIPLLTIHDSILLEVRKGYLHLVDDIKKLLEDVQTYPFNLSVPFIAEYKMGTNWAEATYGS